MAKIKVTKDRYTTESLYQWDKNQILEIYGLSLASIPEIHFSNNTMDKAIVRQATMDAAGVIRADVPNSLLQKPYKVKAHVCVYEGDTFQSLYLVTIPVEARPMPYDYTISDDEEIYSFNALENYVNNAVRTLTLKCENAVSESKKLTDNAVDKIDDATDAAIEAMDKRAAEALEQIQTEKADFSDTIVNVGDVRLSTRSDLGDKFLYCNGDVVPDGTYPALRAVLPYNTDWRTFAPFEKYSTIKPLPVAGQWAMLDIFKNTELNGKTAVLYDSDTDTCTEIACPTIETENRYGIFGLTHDGDKYILGVCEDENDSAYPVIHLFTSTDLSAWTLGYSFTCEIYGNANGLIFDGVEILAATSYYNTSSQYEEYIYAIDKTMTSHKKRMTSLTPNAHYLYTYPSGYWGYNAEDQTSIDVKKAGSSAHAFVLSIDPVVYHTLAFFNDQFWISVPANDGDSMTYLAILVNINGESKLHFSVKTKLFADYDYSAVYFHGMQYDRNTNRWALYFKAFSSGADIHYYIGYISADSDPRFAENYTIERVEALPEKIPHGQMHIDRSYVIATSDTVREIRDPNVKYLPMIDGDANGFIYAGGGDDA